MAVLSCRPKLEMEELFASTIPRSRRYKTRFVFRQVSTHRSAMLSLWLSRCQALLGKSFILLCVLGHSPGCICCSEQSTFSAIQKPKALDRLWALIVSCPECVNSMGVQA